MKLPTPLYINLNFSLLYQRKCEIFPEFICESNKTSMFRAGMADM